MRIAVFSSKPHDHEFLRGGRHEMVFLEPGLDSKTAELAKGFDVACLFVHDAADAAAIDVLADGGCRLIALRSQPMIASRSPPLLDALTRLLREILKRKIKPDFFSTLLFSEKFRLVYGSVHAARNRSNKPRDAECVSLPRLAAITEERV
jgi:hypothetical protein